MRDTKSDTAATVTVISEPLEGISSDERDVFEISAYTGASIDSFAAKETKDYLGYKPDDSGPRLGYVAGVDFAYRPFKKDLNSRWPIQLWLYGQTVHGLRSSEVECDGDKPSAICSAISENPREPFLAILRNSTALEAYGGVRLEFLRLNKDSRNSANLYAKTQLGFMTIQKNGGDVVDDHLKFGLGLIMMNGVFHGSYFEAGLGRSDIFLRQRGRRLKVDGYVQWEIRDKGISPFIQMTVDSDMGPHSDSIRTYYGVNFDVKKIFF